MNKTKFEAFVKLQRHVYDNDKGMTYKLISMFKDGTNYHNPLFDLSNVFKPKAYEEYSNDLLAYLEAEIVKIETLTDTSIEKLEPAEYILYLQANKYVRKYVVVSTEEAYGDEFFHVYIPDKTPLEQIQYTFQMAEKYSNMTYDCMGENPQDYDEHFKEMLDLRASLNGQQMFMYYVQNICGWEMEYIKPDFEFNWQK